MADNKLTPEEISSLCTTARSAADSIVNILNKISPETEHETQRVIQQLNPLYNLIRSVLQAQQVWKTENAIQAIRDCFDTFWHKKI